MKVIVITGEGRSFCAGADLSLVEAISSSHGELGSQGWPTPFNLYMPLVKKPIIAAINGHAVGMGLVLALFCDIRYASSAAKASTAFAKLGLIAEWGSAWMLPKLIGASNSFDLLYSARTIERRRSPCTGFSHSSIPRRSVQRRGSSAGSTSRFGGIASLTWYYPRAGVRRIHSDIGGSGQPSSDRDGCQPAFRGLLRGCEVLSGATVPSVYWTVARVCRVGAEHALVFYKGWPSAWVLLPDFPPCWEGEHAQAAQPCIRYEIRFSVAAVL